MKDEELAKEYAHNHVHYEIAKREDGTDYAKEVSNVSIEQAYLAGLKAGRPKFYKVIDGRRIMNTLLKIKNPCYNAKDCDYCNCEYSVYSESLDHSAPLYCKRCGKVITLYSLVTSEEHTRQLEEDARFEKLSPLLRSK